LTGTRHRPVVAALLERIVERRGKPPELIRCDNGPEFISQALRDWCRFNNTATGYIEPGAPWQNPFVESFNGHLRRELLEMESFNSSTKHSSSSRTGDSSTTTTDHTNH
jgi:transposase InsO family protein